MPQCDSIAATFKRHFDYYCRVKGETCQQQLEGERALKLQYAGRTLFELLQNALDRAQHDVLVNLVNLRWGDGEKECLVVGNDGAPIEVDPNFDYADPPRPRSDFHALCSVHTSNKTPDENMGNKGVGFRSVFSLAEGVQVWSRVSDSSRWWGLELHRELTRGRWRQCLEEDCRVHQGHVRLLGNTDIPLEDDRPRPSFYFPLPLWNEESPIALSDGLTSLVTFVIVPLDSQASETVRKSLDELREAHFHFVGLRGSKREVRIHLRDHADRTEERLCWFGEGSKNQQVGLLASWPRRGSNPPELKILADMAEAAEHAVSRPGVAIAWPTVMGEAPKAKLYCYLPTLLSSPFGVDVHADFQLDLDRTNLKTDDKEPVGKYNRALLEVAAELHLIVVLRHLGYTDDDIRRWTAWKWVRDPNSYEIDGCLLLARADLWRFLNPKGYPSHHLVVEHLEVLLFGAVFAWKPQPQCQKWAELAERFFRQISKPIRATFDAFWDATAAWLDRNPSGCPSYTKKWQDCAKAICDALRTAGARVVPLIESTPDDGQMSVTAWDPLPEQARRRLFLRRGTDQGTSVLHLPKAVHCRGRAITAYRFPGGFVDHPEKRPTGAVPLDRWALLRELRQLPRKLRQLPQDRRGWPPRTLAADQATAQRKQREILRFAAELFTAQFGTQPTPQSRIGHYGPGWRARKDDPAYSEDELHAGQAIATLFLPTRTGQWEPARQLSHDGVDPEWLQALETQVRGLQRDAFLDFLGVSRQQGCFLIEDGQAGYVLPQDWPPQLVDAGPDPTPPLSIPLHANQSSSQSLVDILRAAWPWLGPLVAAEQTQKLNATLYAQLTNHPWYPAGTLDGATPPVGLLAAPQLVAPAIIVIGSGTPDRRLNVLWRVLQSTSQDAQMLKALGAIPSLSDDVLRQDGAHPARRLVAQLKGLDVQQLCTHPNNRQGLLDLFQVLLDAIARAGNPQGAPLPLLVYKASETALPLVERGLTWIEASDGPGWIASNNSQREILRRFFPSLPLVTAVLGSNVVQRLEWLKQRAITIEEAVASTPLAAAAVSLADAVKTKIEPLLPGLLALATVSPYMPQGINDQDAVQRWGESRFVHVAQVWSKLSAHGAGLAIEPQQRSDDVLVEGLAILFSVPCDAGSHPPLRYFADALAERLLGNRALGSMWGQALAEYDMDDKRFCAFLRKQGVLDLEGPYQQLLHPLSPQEEINLRRRLDKILEGFGSKLKNHKASLSGLRHLGLEDLEPPPCGWGELDEETIQQHLHNDNAGWSEKEQLFQPSFACRDYNRKTWQAWLDEQRRRDRLLVLAASYIRPEEGAPPADLEALRSSDIARELDCTADSCLSKLNFAPEAIAWEWLANIVPEFESRLGCHRDKNGLDALLPGLAQYKPVHDILQLRQKVGRHAQPLSPDHPASGQQAPITAGQMAAQAAAKIQRGDEAELALLAYVEVQTRKLLCQYGTLGWEGLAQALPVGARVARQKLIDARENPIKLREALRVSKAWGAAGFDLLGLEEEKGNLLAVRYEVKSVPAEGSAVAVFLSRNELAVYRQSHSNGSGKPSASPWKLIAVDQVGQAVDITPCLEPLLNDQEGPLAGLRQWGFAPEGLKLTIQTK